MVTRSVDYKHGRYRITRRLVALMFEAQSKRYMRPLSELAQEHECSVRTIRRDLEVIESVVPVRWRLLERT